MPENKITDGMTMSPSEGRMSAASVVEDMIRRKRRELVELEALSDYLQRFAYNMESSAEAALFRLLASSR